MLGYYGNICLLGCAIFIIKDLDDGLHHTVSYLVTTCQQLATVQYQYLVDGIVLVVV